MVIIQEAPSSAELVITPGVALQLSDLTNRRFVALYPIGFEMIIGDDGRSQFRIWDEDGLASRLDQTLAQAALDGGGTHWIIYDQLIGKAALLLVARARETIAKQVLLAA